jgi:hypothetical protein
LTRLIVQGWFPTLVGYGLQGFGKFGFYEMFKDVYKMALGSKAAEYQTVGFLVSSACAEVIADVLLCPMEAVSTATIGADPDAICPILFMIDCVLTSHFFALLHPVEGPHADFR